MSVMVGNLKSHSGKDGPFPVVICCDCGKEYSSDRWDYHSSPPDQVLGCCSDNMKLVYKKTIHESIELLNSNIMPFQL